MHLYELSNAAVWHPLRHHRELCLRHHHSQQRQHVRMAESFPRYELPAEPLHGDDRRVNEHIGIKAEHHW